MRISFSGIIRQAESEVSDLADICHQAILAADYISGDSVKRLEQVLKSTFGFGDVIGVSSGSSGLSILMSSLKQDGHTEVMVTSNCGGYATNAAVNAGLNVRVVDISSRTALLDIKSLEKLFEKTKSAALVYTHLYGNYSDFDDVQLFCKSNGIVLIEDCAQALGLKHNNIYAGTKSDFAVLSFYPTKNLGAIGDAGAIVANNHKDASRLRQLRNYGWSDKYLYNSQGATNNRMDSIQAEILLYRLKFLASWNDKRREIRNQYRSFLNEKWGYFFDCEDSIGHLAALRAKDRNQFSQYLETYGIQTSVHYPLSDTQQPAWKEILLEEFDPVSRQLCTETISLPCYPQMTDSEIEYVCSIIARTV